MEKEEILKRIDHTLLKPYAVWEDIDRLCGEALAYHTASVCIPPCYVKRVRETYEGLCICTVIGFPLGYQKGEVKAYEAEKALADGADEIDMVINITDAKSGAWDRVEEEIRQVKAVCGAHVLKVIVEACYLTQEEKIAACRAVTRVGADYIKTSTGFGTGGATLEDVRLFREHIGPDVKIKAAGGVKTKEDLESFLAEGCSRIGTSSAVGLLEEQKAGLI